MYSNPYDNQNPYGNPSNNPYQANQFPPSGSFQGNLPPQSSGFNPFPERDRQDRSNLYSPMQSNPYFSPMKPFNQPPGQSGFGNPYPPSNSYGGGPPPPYSSSSAMPPLPPYGGYRPQNDGLGDLLSDFKGKGDDNLNTNLKAGAAVSELQMILQGERRRTKQLRQKVELDLNNQKKMRVDIQKKLISLKDQQMRRENYIKQLEYKVNMFSQQHNSIVSQNQGLKEEMARLQEIYNQKIRELQQKLVAGNRQYISTEEKYRTEIDRLKQQYMNNSEIEKRQYQFKCKSLEDKCRNFATLKNDMENEIRHLNENIMKIQMEADEQMRERCVRVQEEEYKKFMSNLRTVENKLRASEEARDSMTKKNQALVKDLQDKEHIINDQYMAFENDLSRYKQEISELHNQINQVALMRDQMRNQLANRQAQCARVQADFMDFQRNAQKMKDNWTLQNENREKEHVKQKRQLEDLRDLQARRISDLENAIQQYESEVDRLKSEYDQLCSMLQSNITRTISQTVNDNFSTRPNDPYKPQFQHKY